MKSTLYIRVINGLIIPGLEYENAEKPEQKFIALSAVTPLQKEEKSHFTVSIKRLTETLQVGFISESNDPAFEKRFRSIVEKNLKKTDFLLKAVTGKEIKGILISEEERFSKSNSYEYLLIIRGGEKENRVKILLQNRFFNLFYPKLNSTIQYNDILEEISPFFGNPYIIQPRFDTIIEDLPHEELSTLFNHMLKTSRLSP